MNAKSIVTVSAALWVAAVAAVSSAQESPPPETPATQTDAKAPQSGGEAKAETPPVPPAPPTLRTLAVLDYDVQWIEEAEKATQVETLWPGYVSTRLAATDEWVIVERPRVVAAMKEADLAKPPARAELGKKLGARFVLSGRGFRMDEKIMIANELLDVQTGELRGLVVEFAADVPVRDILAQACDKLVEQLPIKLDDLRSADRPTLGAVEMIHRRLGDKARQWCVAAVEQCEGIEVESAALKGEIERLLTAAGQKVRVLGDSASQALASGQKTLAETLEGETVDYCVISEGHAATMESPMAELAVCRASVEIRILDGRTGQPMAGEAAGDQGTAATSPEAAKGAFQSLARGLLLRLLEKTECGSPDPAADKPED